MTISSIKSVRNSLLWHSQNPTYKRKPKTTKNYIFGIYIYLVYILPLNISTCYIVIIQYKTVKVDGVNIFYGNAENTKKPTILLLHGFPSSSHMFRNLILKNLQMNIISLLLTIQDLETVTNLQSKSLNTHSITWPM